MRKCEVIFAQALSTSGHNACHHKVGAVADPTEHERLLGKGSFLQKANGFPVTPKSSYLADELANLMPISSFTRSENP
jgi:hypothetical protein